MNNDNDTYRSLFNDDILLNQFIDLSNNITLKFNQIDGSFNIIDISYNYLNNRIDTTDISLNDLSNNLYLNYYDKNYINDLSDNIQNYFDIIDISYNYLNNRIDITDTSLNDLSNNLYLNYYDKNYINDLSNNIQDHFDIIDISYNYLNNRIDTTDISLNDLSNNVDIKIYDLSNNLNNKIIDVSNNIILYTDSNFYKKFYYDLSYNFLNSKFFDYYNKSYIDNLISLYYTKVQIDNILTSYYTSTQIQNLYFDKNYINTNIYLKSQTYSQTEINNKINDVSNNIALYTYSKTYLDNSNNIILNKFNDYLTSLQISNTYYNKTYIDNLISLYYTKIQIDNILLNYITSSSLSTTLNNYYLKTQTYSQTEINNLLSNYVLNSYLTSNYALKSYVDNKIFTDTNFNNNSINPLKLTGTNISNDGLSFLNNKGTFTTPSGSSSIILPLQLSNNNTNQCFIQLNSYNTGSTLHGYAINNNNGIYTYFAYDQFTNESYIYSNTKISIYSGGYNKRLEISDIGLITIFNNMFNNSQTHIPTQNSSYITRYGLMDYLQLNSITKTTGTPNSNNFLCGDGSWKSPPSTSLNFPIAIPTTTDNYFYINLLGSNNIGSGFCVKDLTLNKNVFLGLTRFGTTNNGYITTDCNFSIGTGLITRLNIPYSNGSVITIDTNNNNFSVGSGSLICNNIGVYNSSTIFVNSPMNFLSNDIILNRIYSYGSNLNINTILNMNGYQIINCSSINGSSSTVNGPFTVNQGGFLTQVFAGNNFASNPGYNYYNSAVVGGFYTNSSNESAHVVGNGDYIQIIQTFDNLGVIFSDEDNNFQSSYASYINSSGNLIVSSSKKLKYSIREKKNKNYLERLKKVKVYSYAMKCNIDNDKDINEKKLNRMIYKNRKLNIGLIADEISDIFENMTDKEKLINLDNDNINDYNELIKEKKPTINEDEYLNEKNNKPHTSINYNVVCCYLIKCFHEQITINEKLDDENKKLKNRIDDLEYKINLLLKLNTI